MKKNYATKFRPIIMLENILFKLFRILKFVFYRVLSTFDNFQTLNTFDNFQTLKNIVFCKTTKYINIIIIYNTETQRLFGNKNIVKPNDLSYQFLQCDGKTRLNLSLTLNNIHQGRN